MSGSSSEDSSSETVGKSWNYKCGFECADGTNIHEVVKTADSESSNMACVDCELELYVNEEKPGEFQTGEFV